MSDTPASEIEAALRDLPTANLAEGGKRLFDALGYRSDRTLELSGAVDDFYAEVKQPPGGRQTKAEKEFRREAKSVHVLFQLSSEDVAASAGEQQALSLGSESSQFDKGNIRSFIFIAAELRGKSYPRTRYAAFTREINKHLSMPAVVLFKTATGHVTLSFVHRRVHKRDSGRDVLGRVSLLREINAADPHRAHMDILRELTLAGRWSWIINHNRSKDFDGLLSAWLDTLDVQELNKKFYREMFGWFRRAVKEARFPSSRQKVTAEQHIIRLITRLLFIWFIKEKGLVADDLFIEDKVKGLLMDYDRMRGDSYYRAVLQNLFFAVLNTEIGKRKFSSESNKTHRDFSCYRYKAEMSDSDALRVLFNKSPFINGGLFDCLDSFESDGDGGFRIDYFTDNAKQRRGYSIPNRLFFDDNGLIPLLDRYKFTVEENTPVEQEVALDPELLGKVFENLLAETNPETMESARKQSGSFYTPRVVVDYMVDQSLLELLSQRAEPDDGDAKWWRERLQYLLDYEDACDDAHGLFRNHERKRLVQAVAAAKIIDPAVGSGAFPMGMLHKLTLVLRRLDHDNKLWRAVQQQRAAELAGKTFGSEDSKEQRDDALAEISELFERYSDSDFGRKLYLIQNSIFGVDIQTIACQIAKLRFFISLAIEQQPSGDKGDNYGFKPLPNLETRFVAVDTLLGLPKQAMLKSDAAENLERKIFANREQYFHADNRQKKRACVVKDRRLRASLAKELERIGFKHADATKIADWDPYDQNAKADWFDAEYMFGIRDGFDIVIGNPPYVQLQRNHGELRNRYQDAGFHTIDSNGDIYQLFYERGCQLLKEGGHLCYITSNKWMKTEYGRKTRAFFSGKCPQILLDFGGFRVFESATVDTNILLVRNIAPREGRDYLHATAIRDDFKISDNIAEYAATNSVALPRMGSDAWFIGTPDEFALKEKIERMGTPLKEWDISIYRGIITGLNEAFIVDNATKDALVAKDPNSETILKPILRGRDIKRYRAEWAGQWVIDAHNGYDDVPRVDINDYPAVKNHLDQFSPKMEARLDQGETPYNLRSCAYYAEFMRDKIVYPNMTKFLPFYYDASGRYFTNQKCFIVTSGDDVLAYLTAFFNSSLFVGAFRDNFPELRGGTRELGKVFMEKVSVKKPTDGQSALFKKLVAFVQLAQVRAEPETSKIIEGIIDACIMECYFYDEMRQSNLLFQAEVSALFAAFDADARPSKQLAFATALCRNLSNLNHPLRFRLNTLETSATEPLSAIKKRGKAE